MGLNALKYIKMHFPQKGKKIANTNIKNGNKWQKIANNCKISEITKYGEKMPNIAKNVNKMPKMVQNGKNGKTMVKLIFGKK